MLGCMLGPFSRNSGGSLDELEHEANGSLCFSCFLPCLSCYYTKIAVFMLKFTADTLLFSGLCFSCLNFKISKVQLPLPYERSNAIHHNLFFFFFK